MKIEKQIRKIAKDRGIKICESPIMELYGGYGLWEPETHRIFIDPECPKNMKDQVIAHEYIHSCDKECDGEDHGMIHRIKHELIAEYGAKMLVGDKYVDDGFIADLDKDPLITMDAICKAEELIETFIY